MLKVSLAAGSEAGPKKLGDDTSCGEPNPTWLLQLSLAAHASVVSISAGSEIVYAPERAFEELAASRVVF